MTATPVWAACPGPFAGKQCDGSDSSALTNICSTSGGTPSQVVCDLGYNGETSATDATFVMPTHTSFRAYGTDGNGGAFCCEFAVTDGCSGQPITATVYGTTLVDDISLKDPSYDMTCGTTFVYGDDSGDTIVGSRDGSNIDILYGESGADVVKGNAGNDVCYGGDDEDLVWGDEGADFLYGGDGWDQLSGGDGDDYVYGGDGTSTGDNSKSDILGGSGVDHLYGGPYADIICGGPDSDVIYGYDGDDDIFGSVATGDSIVGGNDSDDCDAVGTEGDCNSWGQTFCEVSF